MGLLSNDKTRAKIVFFIRKYNNTLAFLCYISGLCWFFALAYKPINAKTYFSENALIPGLVESEFYHDYGAGNYYKDLKDEFRSMKRMVEESPPNQRDDSLMYAIPAKWLEFQFRSIGLETYIHNYSFKYPIRLVQDKMFEGKNVYGILRAPKAASTEALVLTVPFRSMHADIEKTAAGIAVMLGLAKAFRSKTYWAKDIIFLVTEHESIGMQAWLGAYHYSKLNDIFPAELAGRSGSIQAAVNLELGTDQISQLNVKLEGLNGQLPNLDLVNTVVKLSRQQEITPVIQKRRDYWSPESFEGWKHSLSTMMLMMWHQASGFPTGNHGLFHRYHIEAVTLQGVKIKNAKRNAGFTEMGRMIEGIFRSLNNLMERFHQSFFFYLLAGTDRYVSIGLYMPPFGLLAAPILIKAVALWIDYSFDCIEAKRKTKSGAGIQTGDGQKAPSDNEVNLTGLASTIPIFVMSFCFGLGACYSAPFFVDAANTLQIRPSEGIAMGVLAIFLVSLVYPTMLKRKAQNKRSIGGPNWKLLKCLVLLLLGIILGATALLNISLAFFVTAIWTPVVVLIRPTKSRFGRWLLYALMLAVSPLLLLYFASLVHEHIQRGLSNDPLELHRKTWENVQNGLLHSVVDSYFFHNWIYSIVTVLLWPCWLQLWALFWTDYY